MKFTIADPIVRSLASLLLVFATAQSARADCSATTLEGAYGMSLSGTNYNRNAQWAFVGRFVGDGKGNIAGGGTQSTNGQVTIGQFKGTYEVQADCTGQAIFWFGAASHATIRFVIVDSGKRIEMIVADQGILEIGFATRIVTDAVQTTAPKPVPKAFE